jgi:hypothetical protein
MGSTLLLACLLLSHVSSTVWPASSLMGSLGLHVHVQARQASESAHDEV